MLLFLLRDAMQAWPVPSCGVYVCVCPSVCVCLSRSYILSKRIKISSKFLHNWVLMGSHTILVFKRRTLR